MENKLFSVITGALNRSNTDSKKKLSKTHLQKKKQKKKIKIPER